MALADITGAEIIKAIEECDRLGRETFLRTHGFKRARRYLLSHNGRLYDSKAIIGVAHAYLLGQGPLEARAFSGGADHAVALLRKLGFAIVDSFGAEWEAYEWLLSRLDELKVNRSSGRPLLYQPIALFWAIGRAYRGEARILSWTATEEAVRSLLDRHGMRGERPRPDYPVAALYHVGLWELRDHSDSVPTAHGDSALRRWFADNRPRGGLVESAYDLLHRSGEARVAAIDTLLSIYFDGLDYGPLLHDVGLYDNEIADDLTADGIEPLSPVITAAQYERLCRIVEHQEGENRGRYTPDTSYNPFRSGTARRAVLLRSKGVCENPNCTGQPADVTAKGTPILEVDHVVDLACGGRDHPSRMVALCPNCHAIKTRGRSQEELRAVLLEVARERHIHWITIKDD
ncbi:HNH endonuclease signature motif containing protein [Streptomyces sp. NPDC059892]|uniref:HNH endonuclease signature motif containing protein n=1 Tax=Streptomyces sp. NPDC059892 TaxID=3346989 RepID=UPI0036527112